MSLPISREMLAGKQELFADTDALAASIDTGIDEDLVREVAARQPLHVVFHDPAFKDDSMKTNVGQLFKTLTLSIKVKSSLPLKFG